MHPARPARRPKMSLNWSQRTGTHADPRRPMSRSKRRRLMSRSTIKNPTGHDQAEKLGHSRAIAGGLGGPHRRLLLSCSWRDSRSPRSTTPAVKERAGTAMAPANAACVCCVSGSRSRRVGAPRLAAPRALSCRHGGPSGNRQSACRNHARRRSDHVKGSDYDRKPGCRRAS